LTDFSNSKFLREANFKGAGFIEEAYFGGVEFTGKVNFSETIFLKAGKFRSKFKEAADFSLVGLKKRLRPISNLLNSKKGQFLRLNLLRKLNLKELGSLKNKNLEV
jgi:hypothetical protein